MKRKNRTNRKAGLRAVVRESFVLSFTSRLSAKIVKLFEYGFLSPLLTSVRRTDSFFSDKVFAPLKKRFGANRKPQNTVRSAAASFFAGNRIFNALRALKDRFLATSLRSAGVFLLTYGVYTAAIFLLRRYTSGGADPDTAGISVAAVSFIAGLLLVIFGEKSILSALGNGRITGQLLCDCLGINESSLCLPEKGRNATGLAFLFGSLCGIGTLFVSPARLLFAILVALLAAAIFNVPEFGLLSAVALTAVLPRKQLTVLLLCTLASYLFKCLRLKRNLRFGTADVAFAAVFAVKALFALSGGGNPAPELLCCMCVYFITKNIICSERLILQALNVFCLGVSLAAAFRIANGFSWYIFPESLRSAVIGLTSCASSISDPLFLFLPAVPVALSRLAFPGRRRPGAAALLLIAADRVLEGDVSFAMFALIAVLAYFAFAHKAPGGALLAAAVAVPAVAVLENLRYGLVPNSVHRGFTLSLHLGDSPSGIAVFGAVFAFIMLAAALLLSFQRSLGALRYNNSRSAMIICGAVAASAVTAVLASLFSDPFADVRAFAVLWFTLGLEGSVFGVYTRAQYFSKDV
ncbi:MAG: hypothetical protein J5925_02950 [Clostridia bacterium]|nr:hypothetical protein [Clostridia bacterium]